MEVLGEEFSDMSPQELAAPVNTVTVSMKTGKDRKCGSTSRERLAWKLLALRWLQRE